MTGSFIYTIYATILSLWYSIVEKIYTRAKINRGDSLAPPARGFEKFGSQSDESESESVEREDFKEQEKKIKVPKIVLVFKHVGGFKLVGRA